MNLTCRGPFFAWACTLGVLFTVVPSNAGAAEAKSTTLRVLTYNVQFLPAPADIKNKRPHPEYRATRIAEEASRYDIVGLQETFHDTHRGQILEQLQERWNGVLHSVASPMPEGFYTSGGCLIATRLPMVKSSSIVFTKFSKPIDYGLRADGFAAKGVIHARIARHGESPADFVDVFVTHLESRADELRPSQYAEMAALIKKSSDPSRPAIVLGDMNTRGAKEFRNDANSQYAQLLKLLGDARPKSELIDVWPTLKGDALGGTNEQESHEIGKRIDYLFLLNPPQPHAQLKPISVAVRLFQDPKVVALSDHNAVEVELEWSPSSP